MGVTGALASRDDLLQWAKTTPAKVELPRLIRRLALETLPDAVQLGFPAGSGTSSGGWDGSIRTVTATAFVPAGVSVWELSAGASLTPKADADYAKRTTTPDGSPTKDAVYVQVILRAWQDHESWANGKRGDGRWRDVRGYNVDTIEEWLEVAPVTHAWLSELLSLGPYGYRAAESWWRDWSGATAPPLPSALVLAGRDEQYKGCSGLLTGSPRLVSVRAGSREEALAFVAASVQERANDDVGRARSRTAFVDDVQSWRRLVARRHPLVLVAANEAVAAEAAASNTHHIIVPVVGGSAPADIELPAIDAAAAAAALTTAGMTDRREADEVGRLARRSLIAMRRRLATNPELHQPAWAHDPSRLIRGVILAGRWNDHNDHDAAVIAELAGLDYSDVTEEVSKLARSRDPLVAQVGSSWLLVAPQDAWIQTVSTFRRVDLERLEAAVRKVLLEEDPAIGLDPGERWRAQITGLTRRYSTDLRRGLAETLALVGVHGEQIDAGHGTSGAQWAAYVVREILSSASADGTGRLWLSLRDVLTPLAEAAPDAFLGALRTGCDGEPPVIAAVFTDFEVGDGLFGTTASHSELLWALEDLAWSPQHFGQAMSLLARLTEIDPGGRMSNRPAASLAAVLCPWFPETVAPAVARLAAIDNLRQHHPRAAWRLMLTLLPSDDIHMRTAEPQFRDWKPREAASVLVPEWLSFVAEILDRLLEDVGREPGRWLDLVEHLDSLPPEQRVQLCGALAAAIAGGQLGVEDQARLWEKLRAFVAKHRQYSDAQWALPTTVVEEIDQLVTRIAPIDPVSRLAWLFANQMPDLGDGTSRSDFEVYQARLQQARTAAVEEVLQIGLDAVYLLAPATGVPAEVGRALAEATGDSHLGRLAADIDADDPVLANVAWGWLVRRFHEDGWSFTDRVLALDLSPAAQARVLLTTFDLPRAWEEADRRGPEVAREFWRGFRTVGLGADFAHVTHAARRLVGVGRVCAGLNLTSLYLRGGDDYVDLLIDLLVALRDQPEADPEISVLSQHDFAAIFAYLDKNAATERRSDVARLQWFFLPTLGIEPKVQTLHEALSNEPPFFAQVLALLYRPKATEEAEEEEPAGDDPADEQRRGMASAAFRLLRSYRLCPGVRPDGTVDGTTLSGWVDDVLNLAAASGRGEIAKEQIGHVLANAPADPGGRWPAEPVRDLLETLQSEHVESGLRIELANRRGVTTRGLEDGGAQERALADMYRTNADQFADRWPRTAAVLRALAGSYDADARREESQAERWRRGQGG